MKIIFEHYRIPSYFSGYMDTGRGRPYDYGLVRYSRKQGWGCFLKMRASDLGPAASTPPLSRGGLTRCIVEDGNGRRAVGEAWCSMADNFCYRVGRDIAYGRAWKVVEGWLEEVDTDHHRTEAP